MHFDMPKSVFCGLALIAAAIFFGPGSVPTSAYGKQADGVELVNKSVQPVIICDPSMVGTKVGPVGFKNRKDAITAFKMACANTLGGALHVKRSMLNNPHRRR